MMDPRTVIKIGLILISIGLTMVLIEASKRHNTLVDETIQQTGKLECSE